MSPSQYELIYLKRSFLFKIDWEVSRRYYKKKKFMIFVELENESLLEKYPNHFKNIKTSLRNNLFDKAFMNNILYFASKYFKRTFEKTAHEIGSIKHGLDITYTLFSTQPQCCLTFSWTELRMLLRCCLIQTSIVIMRHFSYLLYWCPCLDLGLCILYLCNLFFMFIIIIIMINLRISWI